MQDQKNDVEEDVQVHDEDEEQKQQLDKPAQSVMQQWIPALQPGKEGGDWEISGITIHWVNTRRTGLMP